MAKNIITEEEKNNVEDFFDLTQYDMGCNELMSIQKTSDFNKILTHILDNIEDDNEIENILSVRHCTVCSEDKSRLMPFCYKSTDFAVMPVKIITEQGNAEDVDSDCLKILDLIWYTYSSNSEDLKYVWECCQGEHKNDYFLLTQESNTDNDWRLYSYGYYCFVNKSKFQMPDILKYEENKEFVADIQYDADNKYEQYFDVYNIMSESKYSRDILTRYLRMYQILEYLGYRKALADMTKGNIKENGFVRNVINKANRGSSGELSELKNGLSSAFPLNGIIAESDITQSQNDFIKNKLMIKNGNHDDAKLWEIIYKLRNCIVHNKESELHFTYTNTINYSDGIDLMKILIEKIEPQIIEVINNHDNNIFEFDDKTVRLY